MLSRLEGFALPKYVKNNSDLSHVNNHARCSQNCSVMSGKTCTRILGVCACVCISECVRMQDKLLTVVLKMTGPWAWCMCVSVPVHSHVFVFVHFLIISPSHQNHDSFFC